jgi:hypothetical protein
MLVSQIPGPSTTHNNNFISRIWEQDKNPYCFQFRKATTNSRVILISAAVTCGRYLAAQSEADHYKREMKREQEEIITVPDTGN